MPKSPILLVDDDPVFREMLAFQFERLDTEWKTYTAGSVAEAQAVLSSHTIELAIVDLNLPDGDAADLIHAAGALPCILCTQADAGEALRHIFNDPLVADNVIGFLVKPLQPDVIWSVRGWLQVAKARREKSRVVGEATARLEEERRLIGQNLHDSFGAILTQLNWLRSSMQGALMATDLPQDFARGMTERCTKMKDILTDAHAQIARVVTELRPEVVRVAGLRQAILFLIRDWQNTAPAVSFIQDISADVDQVDKRCTGIVYRLVQEGLTNAMRHTEPSRVVVNMARKREELHILVESLDGKPFEERPHYELTTIRERTASLGGGLHFTCDGAKGKSMLHVTIPLSMVAQ